MAQDNQAKRNLTIGVGAVCVVVVLLYLAYSWISAGPSSQQVDSSVSDVGSSSSRETEQSEYYSSLLEDYNKNNADTARNADTSYLSVLDASEGEAVEQNQDKETETTESRSKADYSYQPPPQKPPQQQQQREVNDALVNNVQGMMASWTPKPSGKANTVQSHWQPSEQNSHVRNGDSGENGQGVEKTQAAQQALNHKIVPDYAVIPAILDTNIDTDENSLVTAEVPAGPYSGMRFYASGYQRLENTVDFTFTAMRWKGKTYSVNAKPLDVETRRTALSGDVNNRYFERIVIPALARGVAQAGQLYEEASKTTVVTGLGTTVETNDGTVDDREVTGAFVGGLANQTANVLEQDASRIPIKQVLVDGGSTIGIQVIGSVTAADELGADGQKTDLEKISQPAPQPERPQTFQPTGNQRSGRGSNIYVPGQGVVQ